MLHRILRFHILYPNGSAISKYGQKVSLEYLDDKFETPVRVSAYKIMNFVQVSIDRFGRTMIFMNLKLKRRIYCTHEWLENKIISHYTSVNSCSSQLSQLLTNGYYPLIKFSKCSIGSRAHPYTERSSWMNQIPS